MPKAGTHLLTSLLESLPRMRFAAQVVSYLGEDAVGEREEFEHFDRQMRRLRDSHYISGHLTYHPAVEQVVRDSRARIITMVRDPRAQVVSWAHYLLNNRHVPGREWVWANYPDMESLLPMLVRGVGVPRVRPYLPDIGERFSRYSRWSDSSIGIVVRFEDLVGARGGGDDSRQHATTARILTYLGFNHLSPEAVTTRIFSAASATFRTGQIDSWRSELPSELAEEIVERCGSSLIDWGYQP